METYYLDRFVEVCEETDLVISDPYYFGNPVAVMQVHNGCDGLYEVYDDETDEVIGKFGVDTAEVAVFKLTDKVKQYDLFKKDWLYTIIPNFEGVVILFKNDDSYETLYLIKFDGYSNGQRIEWVAPC